MKKIIIGGLVLVFVLCGIGSFFFLHKGSETKEKEIATPKLYGVEDITVQKGEELPETIQNVSANAAVKDVMVDISRVNTAKAGTYPITYTYTDTKGKEHHQEVMCTVTEPEEKELSAEKESKVLADEKLQEGSNPEMSKGIENEKELTPVPKTGDHDWKIPVYLVLLMLSSATIASVCYVMHKGKKL